jgi:hypothetical protein
MPSLGFELTILESERLQTHTLDCAATGIGIRDYVICYILTYAIYNVTNNGVRTFMYFFKLLKPSGKFTYDQV